MGHGKDLCSYQNRFVIHLYSSIQVSISIKTVKVEQLSRPYGRGYIASTPRGVHESNW